MKTLIYYVLFVMKLTVVNEKTEDQATLVINTDTLYFYMPDDVKCFYFNHKKTRNIAFAVFRIEHYSDGREDTACSPILKSIKKISYND